MFENTESLLKQIALGEDSVLEFKTIEDEQTIPKADCHVLEEGLWKRFKTVLSSVTTRNFCKK